MGAPTMYPLPSCKECGLQSAGRCPTCHRPLCIDHFPRQEHEPCAAYLNAHAHQTICYVCGEPVTPHQWSSAVFAHYIDTQKCAGCGRYVCDSAHTKLRVQEVKIVRDGLRSHRYHVTRRYCDVCAPLRVVGGLRGAAWWFAGVGSVVAASLLYYVQFIHH